MDNTTENSTEMSDSSTVWTEEISVTMNSVEVGDDDVNVGKWTG